MYSSIPGCCREICCLNGIGWTFECPQVPVRLCIELVDLSMKVGGRKVISASCLEGGFYGCQFDGMRSCGGVPFSSGNVVSSGKTFTHQQFGAMSSPPHPASLDEAAAGASSQSLLGQCYGSGIYKPSMGNQESGYLDGGRSHSVMDKTSCSCPLSTVHIPGVENWRADVLKCLKTIDPQAIFP